VQYKEKQDTYWNNRSVGWKQDITNAKPNQDPFIRRLIECANIKQGMNVLDVASGAGDPAITIAKNYTRGNVTACDLTYDMLGIAMERAKRLFIENLTFTVGNMSALPFPNNTFDAFTCRNGLMFSDTKVKSAEEALRVLKPGGKAAWLVWGNIESNPTFDAVRRGLESHFDEVFPYRMIRHNLSEPGQLKKILKESGFSIFEEIELKWERQITPNDGYFQRAVARTIPDKLTTLSQSDIKIILENIKSECVKYLRGDIYVIPISMRLGIGTARD